MSILEIVGKKNYNNLVSTYFLICEFNIKNCTTKLIFKKSVFWNILK